MLEQRWVSAWEGKSPPFAIRTVYAHPDFSGMFLDMLRQPVV